MITSDPNKDDRKKLVIKDAFGDSVVINVYRDGALNIRTHVKNESEDKIRGVIIEPDETVKLLETIKEMLNPLDSSTS